MHDRPLGPCDRLVGAVDERLAGLGQHLDGDVIGDQVLLNERAHEVEVSLRCAGEPDLDLLVTHLHQEVEHDALALRAHRVDESLVAVAEVDCAPARGLCDALRRPRAVAQVDDDLLVERLVLVNRHARGGLVVLHLVLLYDWSVSRANDKLRDEGGLRLGLVAAAKKEHAVQHIFQASTFRRSRERVLHCSARSRGAPLPGAPALLDGQRRDGNDPRRSTRRTD